MRTMDEILADARPGRAFSNATQFDVWSPRWCFAPCVHDNEDAEPPVFCPILSVAVGNEVIPKEWVADNLRAQIHGNYRCTQFEADPGCPVCHQRDGHTPDCRRRPADPEPPVEQLPGQMGLF